MLLAGAVCRYAKAALFPTFKTVLSYCVMCCDTTRPIALLKVSVRLIRHPQLNYSATKLHECIDLSYVPCNLCQCNEIYSLGKILSRAWHTVRS